MPIVEEVFELLGKVVAIGGGSATVAYLIFQHLGKTWIENKLAQRLDQHKHLQALELQRLRVEIDSMLSGVLRIQEREFTLLPEAWAKLDEAYRSVAWFVCPLHSVPDIDRMTDVELDEFLTKTEYLTSQKNQIKISPSNTRHKVYHDIDFMYKSRKVNASVYNLTNFIARNGIFFPSEIKEKISKVTDLLWSAITLKEEGVESQDHKLQGQGRELVKTQVEPLYKEIEILIQSRLHSHAAD